MERNHSGSNYNGIKRKNGIDKRDMTLRKFKNRNQRIKNERLMSYDEGSKQKIGLSKENMMRRKLYSFSQQNPRINRRRIMNKQSISSDPRMIMITNFVKQTQWYIQKLYWSYKKQFQLTYNENDNYNNDYNQFDTDHTLSILSDDHDDTTQADTNSKSFPIDNNQLLLSSSNIIDMLLSSQKDLMYYYKQKNKPFSSYNSLSYQQLNQFELLADSTFKQGQKLQKSINDSYEIVPNEQILIKINELIEEKLSMMKAKINLVQEEIINNNNQIETMKNENHSFGLLIKERKEEMDCGINTMKTMYQYIKDLRSNINVYCRVKPTTTTTIIKNITYPEYIEGNIANNNNLHIIELNEQSSSSYHNFDNIFTEDNDQLFLFNRIKENFGKVLEGQHLSFLLLGQSNSGKSYTLKGNLHPHYQNDEGIIQRFYSYCIQLSQRQSYEIKIFLSVISIVNDITYEIYYEHKGDQCYKFTPLPLNQFYTNKWTLIPSKEILSKHLSYVDSLELLNGKKHEAHIIYQFKIEYANQRHSDSLISFIKTTGSECLLYQNSNPNYYDTKAIKTIGKVISMLIDKKANKSFIPYKETKITQILRNVFKSCSKIIIILTIISDSNSIEETRELMKFSQSLMLSF